MSTEAAVAQGIQLNTTQEIEEGNQQIEPEQEEEEQQQQTQQQREKETLEIHDHDGDGFPDHYILPASNLETNAQPTKCCTDDIANRTARYLFITVVPVMGIMICLGKSDLNQILGISILLMYAFYFCTLGYYFFSVTRGESNYLFRVYTAASRVNLPVKTTSGDNIGWARLNVASHQQLYPLKPIHSISEFSAIDGAVPSIMLANLGQYTWAIVTLHFMMNIKFRQKYGWGISDTFSLIGASGLVMLGVFEADPFNKYMQRIHMLGAFLGFGTLIGFLVQQSDYNDKDDNGNYFASVLVLFFVLFYVLWNFNLSYCEKREKQKFKPLSGCEKFSLWIRPMKCCANVTDEPMIRIEDITAEQKKEITHLSLLNVIFEAVVLFVGATALSLFIFYYNVAQAAYDYSDDYYDNPYYQDNGFYGGDYDTDSDYYNTPSPYYGDSNGYTPTSDGGGFSTSF